MRNKNLWIILAAVLVIALVALLVVAIVACGVRAATDARHAEGSAPQPAAEEGAASQQAASEGAPRIAVEGPDGDAAAVLGGEQAGFAACAPRRDTTGQGGEGYELAI